MVALLALFLTEPIVAVIGSKEGKWLEMSQIILAGPGTEVNLLTVKCLSMLKTLPIGADMIMRKMKAREKMIVCIERIIIVENA